MPFVTPIPKPRRLRDSRAIAKARKPWCELCGRWGTTQVHHIIARGMGGGRRCDEPWNLIALCPACHRAYHDGRILIQDLVRVVCEREAISRDEWFNKAAKLEVRV